MSRILTIAFCWLTLPLLVRAQSGLTCQTSAVPPVVRAEGVAERMGDIVLSCAAAPGTTVSGNLTVFLDTTITNLDRGSGNLDAVLTVNDAPSAVSAVLDAANRVSWYNLNLTVPASGALSIRISNLRADATRGGQTPPPGTSWLPLPITAQLAFNPGGLLNFSAGSRFSVAIPEPGLYATSLTRIVPSQSGSPLPENTTSFTEFLRGDTFFSSTRISEGHAAAFEPRVAQTTQGTRIMLRVSGYPADARIFVPAALAGSSAAVPTTAGDFGGAPSGGRYVQGSNSLLLVRVLETDAQGQSGTPANSSIAASGDYDAMSEVRLTGGTGIAVYEVVDASPQRRESAQIPIFVGLARSESARSVTTELRVTFAPISTTSTTSLSAPIPRFIAVNALPDCGLHRDCETYVPSLDLDHFPMTFSLTRGVGVEQRPIYIVNKGGGLIRFSVTINYKRGSGWILVTPSEGTGTPAIRTNVLALPEMQPGVYEAEIIVDAGPAGTRTVPVRLTVVEGNTSPPPPVSTTPRITAVVHGATFQAGAVARGSIVTLRGTNLTGSTVSVTFDGKPARILYTSSDQINLQVPADLSGNTAQVVVTAGGVASPAFSVNVAAANPGIFTPGVLNQDGSVNSPTNPADTGSMIQVFATGLLSPDGAGVIDARLHDLTYTTLPYAGPAPGLPGIQQVNMRVQEGWPTMQTELLLCTNAGGARQCSAPVKIYLRGF